MPETTQKQTPESWYTLNPEKVLEKVNSNPKGLSGADAQERLKQYGYNVLPTKAKVTLAKVILHQFKSPLIYVLLIAGVVAFLVGEYSDAGFIVLILLINAVLGAWQEWKAESNAAALQDLMKIQTRVLRDGKVVELEADDLVPGDVVLLESGNKVPADVRLLQANQLTIEEALLTGESLPVTKISEELPEGALPIGDRLNMAHAGTTVMSGRGRGVVVATGLHTELGLIASSLVDVKSAKAPLVLRMEAFARRISIVVLVACALLGGIGFANGIPMVDLFFFMIAIAVSAIPEGLPISMTVALSIATMRMAKRHVIVRKLTAVEGLGSCTYIATDKTGTLTVDQQTARVIQLASGVQYTITGEGYTGEGDIHDGQDQPVNIEMHSELEDLVAQVTVCNEAMLEKQESHWRFQGDAIDVALLALGYKTGRSPNAIKSEVEVLREVPFESERKYAAVYYSKGGRNFVAVKGALEVLLKYADEASRAAIEENANALAAKGYRIIAVAKAEVDNVQAQGAELPPISLLGFVALLDPMRPEAKVAIEECHRAGVNVAMVTGDHPATALHIAQELGIAVSQDQVITGADLGEPATADDPEFQARVKNKRVFARVSPRQKQLIVEALKIQGHFVAVTGDGVNDAPALKSAHIGVAMGYGTDVAKETASIILTDNNFASIAAGIEEGRYAYGNLRKIIYLLISTGAAEITMIALALIFGLPLPFLAVQILWLNLVTNGIQDKGIAFEKGEKNLMENPPRNPSESVFNPLMMQQVLISGGYIALITFATWYYMLNHLDWPEFEARNTILLLMVLLQNFHVFNCRSETRSAFSIPLGNNKWLILGILLAQGIHILSMHLPFMQNLLSLEPIPLQHWLVLLAMASTIMLVMELFKWFKRRQLKQQPVKAV